MGKAIWRGEYAIVVPVANAKLTGTAAVERSGETINPGDEIPGMTQAEAEARPDCEWVADSAASGKKE